jgi:uncharacterized protein (TIGR02145 family)
MNRLLFLIITFATMSTAMAQQREFVVYYDGARYTFDAEKVDSMKFVKQSELEFGGYKCVDLGLSVMWATHNLGTTNPTEAGEYFDWTPNIPFGDYDSYDDGWRMPTSEEFKELCEKCTWWWQPAGNERYNGVAGYEIEGANGNIIFMPAAGYYNTASGQLINANPTGYYWSSDENTTIKTKAYNLRFNGSDIVNVETMKTMLFTIRPVYAPEQPEEEEEGETNQ